MLHIFKRYSSPDIILIVLIFLEMLFSIIPLGNVSQTFNAFGFFLSGLAFAAVFFLKYYNKTVQRQEATMASVKNLLLPSVSVILLVLISFQNKQTLNSIPIDVKTSDVIPTVIELCTRFNDGSFVYEPIEKFGYHLPVTYLPMQWMPFLLAEQGEFDYRWIAIGIWLIAALILMWHSFRSQQIAVRIVGPLLLLAAYYFISFQQKEIVANVIELMVAGYYMLLMYSLGGKNAALRGLMIGICLMSRYSLLLWLPLAAVVVFMNESRRQFWISAGTCLLFVLIIYIIPFLSKDWNAFYRGYKYYDLSALGEWQHLNPSTGKPYHLYAGHGIAYFFYEHFPQLSLPDKIKRLQKAHLLMSLGTTTLLTVFYFLVRRRIDYRMYLLFSFKIYLAVFLFLIQVPYLYLMIVSFFVSIAIFIMQGKYRLSPNEPSR